MAMPANAEVVVNNVVPLNALVFVPCANGGAGELIQVSGNLHVLQSLTVNGNRFRFKTHNQPQGASAVGLVTGDTYRAVGVTQNSVHDSFVNGSYNSTFVNNFRMIGPGPGNNLNVHTVNHVTLNANGDITSSHSNPSFSCS